MELLWWGEDLEASFKFTLKYESTHLTKVSILHLDIITACIEKWKYYWARRKRNAFKREGLINLLIYSKVPLFLPFQNCTIFQTDLPVPGKLPFDYCVIIIFIYKKNHYTGQIPIPLQIPLHSNYGTFVVCLNWRLNGVHFVP